MTVINSTSAESAGKSVFSYLGRLFRPNKPVAKQINNELQSAGQEALGNAQRAQADAWRGGYNAKVPKPVNKPNTLVYDNLRQSDIHSTEQLTTLEVAKTKDLGPETVLRDPEYFSKRSITLNNGDIGGVSKYGLTTVVRTNGMLEIYHPNGSLSKKIDFKNGVQEIFDHTSKPIARVEINDSVLTKKWLNPSGEVYSIEKFEVDPKSWELGKQISSQQVKDPPKPEDWISKKYIF